MEEELDIEHASPEVARLAMSVFLQECAARGAIFHFAGFNVSLAHADGKWRFVTDEA